MSKSYLIKIDNDIIEEKEDILKYILNEVNQDDMINKIDEIKCITKSNIQKICQENINNLGQTIKQKEICNDICKLCNKIYKKNENIFKLNICNHTYHKRCINKLLKTNFNICIICNDSYLTNLINYM
jgi:4-hydroxy-3-methylbut-2-enyl diphosphate reductase IspH